MSHLFCFGLGYSASALARRCAARGWRVTGTSRTSEGVAAIEAAGYRGILFDGTRPVDLPTLAKASHVLVSIPPGEDGDPVLRHQAADIEGARHLAWLAYLSTTGVYGDRGGGWVDEASPTEPTTERGRRRLAAEEGWRALAGRSGLPLHVFRLAGIYGPGRSQLETVKRGTARRVVRDGQVFSRIHVEDVAGILEASMANPRPGALYNVCDDEPAPPQDVVAFAAELLGRPPPPEATLEDASLSEMSRSFFAESKRVRNDRIRDELAYRLLYPTYREGLRGLMTQP